MKALKVKNRYNKLFKALEHQGFYSRDKLKNLLKNYSNTEGSLVERIIKDSNGNQDEVLEFLSKFFEIPIITLEQRVIAPQIINLIPKELAEQNSVIIFKKNGQTLQVATIAPDNTDIINFIERKTGLKTQVFLTTPRDINYGLKKYKTELNTEFEKIIADSTKEALAIHESAEKMAQYVPIIKMVDTILERALDQNASDVHIQPTSEKILIRFRVDGLLHNVAELPHAILPPLVARIKIISNLKIDVHNTPQDSRFSFNFNDRDVALRVSVIPTLNGAKIVLRVLDMENRKFTLRRLGLNKRDFQLMKEEMIKPNGMILVTGPTGSGKTTTLYTLLHMLNREDINICTIEDPIEYGIDGVNQTQINPHAKLTFANGLRSLLRQDPDVLMVGEIRDAETAAISVNSAMTGHMVLSTVHTNNAFLAPQRLAEMELPNYLLSSVLNIIIAQRLVRKICLGCKTKIHSNTKVKLFETYDSTFKIKESFGKLLKFNLLNKNQTKLEDIELYYGKGCQQCNNTGFSGRIGIYEIVKVTPDIQKIIAGGGSAEEIQKAAANNGTLTMIEDGLLKILNGRTTFDEVMRLTKE